MRKEEREIINNLIYSAFEFGATFNADERDIIYALTELGVRYEDFVEYGVGSTGMIMEYFDTNEYEINFCEEDGNDDTDFWGAAFMWSRDGTKGVEYNFCIENGNNYCAFYKMVEEDAIKRNGSLMTDKDTDIHYEVDFTDPEWKSDFVNAMIKAYEEYFFV